MAFEYSFTKREGETDEEFGRRAWPGLDALDALNGDARFLSTKNEDLVDGWQRTTIIIESRPI